MTTLYTLGLLLHIIGITLIAGGFIGSAVAERLLWQQLNQSQVATSAMLLPLLKNYPSVIRIGSLLMLVSGLLMLWGVNWLYWGQLWLTLKLILYVLLTLNGALIAGPTQQRLVSLLGSENQSTDSPASLQLAVAPIRQRMNLFLLTEGGMLMLVYVLAIFKPV